MLDAIGAVQNALLGSAQVSALVGSRVRPWPAGQMLDLPCVLLALVVMTNAPTMGGITVDRARVQVDCLARTPSERRSLGNAVMDALVTYSDNTVDRILFVSASERTDDRSGHYGLVMEFDVVGR